MLPVLSLCLLCVFANPLTGPVWISIITGGAYWRLWFLLPVILGAGLLGECLLRALHRNGSRRLLAVAMSASLLVLPVFANRAAQHSPAHLASDLAWGRPFAPRLPAAHQHFASTALPRLQGRNVLTAKEIFPSLALLDPSLRFEAGRFTRHTFASARRPKEGERHERAMAAVTRCDPDAGEIAAQQASLERGVDALVLGPCYRDPRARAALAAVKRRTRPTWSEAAAAGGYTLPLRDPSALR